MASNYPFCREEEDLTLKQTHSALRLTGEPTAVHRARGILAPNLNKLRV